MDNTEIKLVLIGYADENHLLIARARQMNGAYVITNIETNRKEVYAIENNAQSIKNNLFPNA